MKQIITIALLLMCSSFGYAQRNNNNKGNVAKPKSQTSAAKPKQNGGVQHSTPSKTVEPKLTPPVRYPQELRTETFNVNGVSFRMSYVKGGEFLMGATSEQKNDNYNAEPVHKVILDDYFIGQTEVTRRLWYAVMSDEVYDNYTPMNDISYADCDKFIVKLNSLTGLIFRLPTEEEWEFACRGGNNSKDYMYSGSNFLEDVAWYKYNSGGHLHDVATKQPNELGIYDMCGNINELCAKSQTSNSVIGRGGDFQSEDNFCKISSRSSLFIEGKGNYRGFRLALTRIPSQYREQERQKLERQQQLAREEAQRKQDEENRNALRWDDATKTFYYNGQSYKMVAVEGGTFTMGATKERKGYMPKEKYEATKAHEVTLSSYYIGQTEFTRGFLRAVMGLKNGSSKEDLLPQNLSWDDCKKIADWLSQFTGRNFCIPSEAEWEFAARGGNRSHGYLYSGFATSSYVEVGPNYFDYAVTNSYANGSAVKIDMKNVASKKPNELGLYDMTGNVWEWCADWYAKYETKNVTNPMGPSTGTMRVYRGGSHIERDIPKVYDRFCDYPDKTYSNVGFRLCLRP